MRKGLFSPFGGRIAFCLQSGITLDCYNRSRHKKETRSYNYTTLRGFAPNFKRSKAVFHINTLVIVELDIFVNELLNLFASNAGQHHGYGVSAESGAEKEIGRAAERARKEKTSGQTNEAQAAPEAPKKKEGCYIATAVYGSYDAPEVRTLRRFRDETLKKSAAGRMFIRIYYRFSPPIAQRLKHATKVNRLVRRMLDGFVENLNEEKS